LTIVGIPVWVGLGSAEIAPLNVFDVLGLGAWITGFSFEVVADWQMARFKKTRMPDDKIMKTGLWKYSRHPNYFGETVLWWGLFFLALSNGAPLWTVLGPLTITFLLLKVSGVPLLEKQYSNNPAYRKYQEVTSSFIPWVPKK
jgi:steroid 5-alpha reductase family enzyme